MQYKQLVSFRVYKNPTFHPPKGEKPGFENLVFVVGPDQEDIINLLRSKFIDTMTDRYRYYTDVRFSTRIGPKKILKNDRRKIYDTFHTINDSIDSGQHRLKLITYSMKKDALNRKLNMMIDLSRWMDLFLQYRRIRSVQFNCESFIDFMVTHMDDSDYEGYHRYLMMDIVAWTQNGTEPISMDRHSLDNPISVMLYALYRYPELFEKLSFLEDIILINSNDKSFMRINLAALSEMKPKQRYMLIVRRLKILYKFSFPENSNMENPEAAITKNDESEAVVAQPNPIAEVKTRIINRVKKNFIGDVDDELDFDTTLPEDLPKTTYNDEEEEVPTDPTEDIPEEISIEDLSMEDNELDDLINVVGNEVIKKRSNRNPTQSKLLDQQDLVELRKNEDAIVEEITQQAIQVLNYTPFEKIRSEIEQNNIQKLQTAQSKVIQTKSATERAIATTVKPKDISNVVDSLNPALDQLTFANFDKAYSENILTDDIDNAVAALSQGGTKVFIISKSEEDTSDQLNLKKTLTYSLKDERGKRMTVKFDVPIVFDGNYIRLNGANKHIGHMLVLKPITKVGKDKVIVTTFYNKATITRVGKYDALATSIKKMMLEKSVIQKMKVKFGNSVIKNNKYLTTLEFDMIASNIHEFTLGSYRFITEIDELMRIWKEDRTKSNPHWKPDGWDRSVQLPVAWDSTLRTVIFMNRENDYAEFVTSCMPAEMLDILNKVKIRKRIMYATIKILKANMPLIFFLLFCEGFTETMKKMGAEYQILHKKKDADALDQYNWGITRLADCWIAWKRKPMKNSMLLNGLAYMPMETYTLADLDMKDTYIALSTKFFSWASSSFNLDQFRDFMIDPKTVEILEQFGYPTDLSTLLIYAADLLTNNDFLPENDYNNMRVRSTEIIPFFVYTNLTRAYNAYRHTQTRKNAASISIKQDAILKDLKLSVLVDDASSLNPILQLEKDRQITYRGERGINMDRAMTLPKRAMTKSMVGVVGITTPNDGNVGITRQLTLEPNVTSTYGFIQAPSTDEEISKMNSANLLTMAELLTPGAVLHDDPDRTSINCLMLSTLNLVNCGDRLVKSKLRSI